MCCGVLQLAVAVGDTPCGAKIHHAKELLNMCGNNAAEKHLLCLPGAAAQCT
jgi:hypothetical protein